MKNSNESPGEGSDSSRVMEEAALNSLYASSIERERLTIWGKGALCEVFSLSNNGEQIIKSLTEFWIARRIPSIENPRDEDWRLEIIADQITTKEFQSVAIVRLTSGTTQEWQKYEVVQAEPNIMQGNVYLFRMVAIKQ